MSTLTQTATERRVLLQDVSWETYEALNRDLEDQNIRMTFDEGTLELMSPSPSHEKIGKFIARLIETLTLELEIPIVALGRTTWRRRSLGKGLEADECYYFTRIAWATNKEDFDLETDPPPDLAVEVDISGNTTGKLSVYAALGVPEVWRFEDDVLHILTLTPAGDYSPAAASRFLPMLPTVVVEEFISERSALNDTAAMTKFRNWVRKNCSRP